MTPSQAWFRVYATWVGTVYALAAIACFIDRDEWFSAHSLRVFHDLTHIPWPAIGIVFAAVPALLLHRKTRLWAWAIAFVLSIAAIFTLWLFTILDHQIINVIISLLSLIVPLAMLTGVRWCVLVEARADRKVHDR